MPGIEKRAEFDITVYFGISLTQCFFRFHTLHDLSKVSPSKRNQHMVPNLQTSHKLWTEICEIRQNFKGYLIKFCEIFRKITLDSSKIVKSHYLNVRSL